MSREDVEAGHVTYLRPAGIAARWALLADPHVPAVKAARYGPFAPDACLREAVDQVLAWMPDGAIVNGDVSWKDGLAGDYRRCRSRLRPLASSFPVVLNPGNHDRRDRLLHEFSPDVEPETAKTIVVIEAGPVRIVTLDSLYRTDVVPGHLGKAQREWLAAFLDAAEPAPTVIFVHHPLSDLDGSLFDGDRLLAVLEPRRQVKAVFTAHDHLFGIERRAGLHVVAQPAVGFAFDPEGSAGWLEAEFSAAGVSLRPRTAVGAPVPAGPLELGWRSDR